MSRDLHFQCEQHNAKSDELGHADRVLVVSRRMLEDRKELLELFERAHDVFQMDVSDIFDRGLRAAVWFFQSHPECNLELIDEYGTHYDLSAEPQTCYAVLQINEFELVDSIHTVEMDCQRDQADGHTAHIHISTDNRGVEYKVTWSAWKGKGD